MALRERGQAGKERGRDTRRRSKVDDDGAERSRADELIRGAGTGRTVAGSHPTCSSPNDDERVEVDAAVREIGSEARRIPWDDPRRLLPDTLCVEDEIGGERERRSILGSGDFDEAAGQ
jgi:hypothetical protein